MSHTAPIAHAGRTTAGWHQRSTRRIARLLAALLLTPMLALPGGAAGSPAPAGTPDQSGYALAVPSYTPLNPAVPTAAPGSQVAGPAALVKDLDAAPYQPGFSAGGNFTDVAGTLVFSAWTPGSGVELWESDGTPAGTRQIQEIAPGAQYANPEHLTVAGRYLFFTANDGSHGRALWALPLLSRPFRRTTVGLGALVQAEDFDRGGERLAYHDRDPFNRGGAYRPDETVDLQTDVGSSGGVHLAWTQAGEWLNYTVDVAETQTYTLTVRVAAQGAGGVFHIALDGADWTGPLHIPDTGGWYSWRTLEKSGLTLAAGRHTLRLVLDADGATSGVGNIDWISLLAPVKYRVLLPVVD